MVEAVDEVLVGEPLYRAIDKDGNIVLDNIRFELITKVLKKGTVLNKAFFDIVMPSGLICMWSGSVVPTGWYLCDGTNGTPDLRNRFIVGAGDEYSIGNTGGEKQHTLTINEMPSHSHTYSYEYGESGNITVGTAGSKSVIVSTDSENDSTSNTGGGKPQENRPPYYALAYIMKA